MGGSLSIERYRDLAPAFNEALIRAECTTADRAAMFCAQIGHESVGLKYMEEIASGAAYEGRQDLGNTQPGDGVRFKGRGPIQITGRANYLQLSRWAYSRGYCPTSTYFVDNPTKLSDVDYGFLGAVWYWTAARPMNTYADNRDIVGATRAVNGGLNGIDDRKNRYYLALSMGASLLPGDDLVAAKDDIINFIKTYVGPIGSDVKDIREQLVGGRDLVRRPDGSVDLLKSFPGWALLGKRADGSNRTLVDAVGVLVTNQADLIKRVAELEKRTK